MAIVSVAATLINPTLTPLACCIVHDEPASVLRKSDPLSPTAYHRVFEDAATPWRLYDVVDGTVNQDSACPVITNTQRAQNATAYLTNSNFIIRGKIVLGLGNSPH